MVAASKGQREWVEGELVGEDGNWKQDVFVWEGVVG